MTLQRVSMQNQPKEDLHQILPLIWVHTQKWNAAKVTLPQKFSKYIHLNTNKFSIQPTDEPYLKLEEYQKTLLNCAQQMRFEQIMFQTLHEPQLVSMICHIQFHQLKRLHLIKCNIVTIESLAYLDAPNLKNLIIDQKITITKAFTKMNFPQLQTISISTNEILQLRQSNRWNFDLKTFYFPSFVIKGIAYLIKTSINRQFNQYINDLTFLAKLCLKSLKLNQLRTNLRIYEEAAYQRVVQTSMRYKPSQKKTKLLNQVLDESEMNKKMIDMLEIKLRQQ